jgi:hypothetical protein
MKILTLLFFIVLLEAANATTEIPPEGWTAIGAIVTAVLAFFTRLIERKKDKKAAKRAIQKAVEKTKDGELVIPEQELKDSSKGL